MKYCRFWNPLALAMGSCQDCHLSDKAWDICFKVRRERAERMYGLRSWRNIQEIKEVEKT